MIALGIYVLFLSVMSLITFCFYYADKRRAIKGKWRVKESVLLGLGLAGGAVGALIAMTRFHHKTSKEHWYFKAGNVLFIVLHAIVAIFIVVFWGI